MNTTTALPDRLAHALVALVPQRPDALQELLPLYADDMVFRDPIQILHGKDAFAKMNERLLRRMRTLEWTIETVRGDDSDLFLEWKMRGTTNLGPRVQVDGVTRARARDGRIVDHRDYWDLGELVASAVPGKPRLLRAIVRPFA
jgi:hypothetical protein